MRAGRPLSRAQHAFHDQQLRAVLGHERVRQGMGHGLIGADPEPERLALTRVGRADLDGLTCQADQGGGAQYP